MDTSEGGVMGQLGIRRRGRRQARPRARNTVALIAGLALTVVAISGQLDLGDSQARAPGRASVTIAPGAALTAVPRSWLGLSTEYWALPRYARRPALFERVLALLRPPGSGPMVLRIGGDSADRAFWDPHRRRLPGWAFAIDRPWLHVTAALVRRLRLRLIVDLNLITGSPAAAAAWARAAVAGLPRGSIAGFEIGNEPDLYNRAFWTTVTAAGHVGGRVLPTALTPADYVADFRADARALRRVAPGVPILGPAVANAHTHAGWVALLLRDERSALGAVTAHRYPFSACARRRSPAFATTARLLGRPAGAGLAGGLHAAIALAHHAGLGFRLTELNSVTCGGRPGVSNAFATALWAPDALLRLLRAGVDAVNLHIRTNTINAPFALRSNGLFARPLLYGLILFTRMLGPHAALVRLTERAAPALRLSAWAVRAGAATLHVLLVNEGGRRVRVSLRLPTAGTATIERLRAPSPASRSGVTLAGQSLGADGAWRGPLVAPDAALGRRGYAVTVPRFSAALLTARLAPAGSAARARSSVAGPPPP